MNQQTQTASIRSLPIRERLVILSILGLISLLCWVYLVDMAFNMDAMMAMGSKMESWTPSYFVAMLLMWIIMMIGMMIPTAIPTILVFAAVARKAEKESGLHVSTSTFVFGYVLIWSLFSAAATLAQWGLDEADLLSSMMASKSPVFGAGLLTAAGIYQLTPGKTACLKHCRSPAQFISRSWKPGAFGAFRMGLEHGAFCLGCCWILMGLLFFGGVMSLIWIGGITLFVLLEKIIPYGIAGGRLAGIVMTFSGLILLGIHLISA